MLVLLTIDGKEENLCVPYGPKMLTILHSTMHWACRSNKHQNGLKFKPAQNNMHLEAKLNTLFLHMISRRQTTQRTWKVQNLEQQLNYRGKKLSISKT